MADYEKLMKKCIQLAKKGEGNTAPNPMVGCIILNKNNEIISTGYHHKYGKNIITELLGEFQLIPFT